MVRWEKLKYEYEKFINFHSKLDTRGHAEVESEPDTDEEAEEEEDDEQKKKKKRDTSKTAKSTSTSSDKTSNVSKRPSFEWSDLFGLDRKKKSILPTSSEL